MDGIIVKTYGMVVSTFFVSDKNGKVRFFEENFLLADVKLDIVPRILLLIMSIANIDSKV